MEWILFLAEELLVQKGDYLDYFLEFHWWYIPVGLVLIFILFGKGKGGIVVRRFTANLEILDARFEGCSPEADYSIFKEGQPDKIDIEIERLTLPVGDELEFQLNGATFAIVKVKKNHEAEFEQWSDEGIEFPVVKAGDELIIKYHGMPVLKGTFRLNQ